MDEKFTFHQRVIGIPDPIGPAEGDHAEIGLFEEQFFGDVHRYLAVTATWVLDGVQAGTSTRIDLDQDGWQALARHAASMATRFEVS